MKTKFLSLLIAVFAFAIGSAQELVTNGNFNAGGTGWSGNALNVVTVGGNSYNEANVAAAGNAYDSNLSYVLPLTGGTKYTLTFDSWSTAPRAFIVGLGLNHDPYTSVTTTQNITATQTTYTMNFTPTVTDTNSRIIFDMGAQTGIVRIDNVSLKVFVADPTTDATLTDLKVNGTSIIGFSPDTTTYTYSLPTGTTTIPQITSVTKSNVAASAAIVQATALPGTATVNVTAVDGSTMKTYTVNYILSGPATPAPTPPARNAADVVSLFSDAYTPIVVNSQDAGYCGANSIENIQVAGDNIRRWTGNACQGIDFSGAGNHKNLSAFDHLHIDFYTEDVSLVGRVFNLKLVNFAGGAGESSSLQVNINDGTNPGITKLGSWISIDIPITAVGGLVAGSVTRDDIAQAVISSNLGKLWYDNFYVYKGSPLATGEVSAKNNLQVYPNPVAANSNFNITGKVKSVKVYSMNGQVVKTSSSSQISTQGMAKGIYIVEAIQEDGSVKRSKLIVK
ncbi:T9SS type A sorting domain-containing protein [Halpernia frigidisoli]|uniref:Por secretion system C-terminal sorting domain-containing protein n=1 Tax=Halpernia frigidisoli TaxID=1125876 RepID=A0A1I3FUE8_9FLAO|nr:T9SS type A sorting domain-containing protein [Halpernia frigidisoli]SFI14829.1 Por secretion system C-terminal sorting domain-containing protein [Halpernia frigidisoli]